MRFLLSFLLVGERGMRHVFTVAGIVNYVRQRQMQCFTVWLESPYLQSSRYLN